MPRSRRVRTLVTLGVLAVALGLSTGPADPAAVAAPSTFTIVGGGYGHAIGMSQYVAHGMALRGASAGRIISFYYGGAQARPASLPSSGGTSVFDLSRRRVFWPTRAGTGVVVRYETALPRPGCRCPRPASSCAGAAWTSTWSATTRA